MRAVDSFFKAIDPYYEYDQAILPPHLQAEPLSDIQPARRAHMRVAALNTGDFNLEHLTDNQRELIPDLIGEMCMTFGTDSMDVVFRSTTHHIVHPMNELEFRLDSVAVIDGSAEGIVIKSLGHLRELMNMPGTNFSTWATHARVSGLVEASVFKETSIHRPIVLTGEPALHEGYLPVVHYAIPTSNVTIDGVSMILAENVVGSSFRPGIVISSDGRYDNLG